METGNNVALSFSFLILIRSNSSYDKQRFFSAICVNKQIKVSRPGRSKPGNRVLSHCCVAVIKSAPLETGPKCFRLDLAIGALYRGLSERSWDREGKMYAKCTKMYTARCGEGRVEIAQLTFSRLLYKRRTSVENLEQTSDLWP